MEAFRTSFCISLCFTSFALFSCSQPPESTDIEISEDAGFSDGDLFDSDPADELRNSQEFQKPASPYIPPLASNALWETDALRNSHEEGYVVTRSRVVGREHLRSGPFAVESWLYTGEYFVLDSSFYRSKSEHPGVDFYPANLFAVAIHNGRMLPFRYLEVSEAYPTMDEIESWGEEKFSTTEIIFRDISVAHNYTIVIPPWAFSTAGTYNIQIFVYPVWTERTNLLPFTGPLLTDTSASRRSGVADDRTYTIYYGSERMVPTSPRISDRSSHLSEWDSTFPGPSTARSNFMLLTPPRDYYEWHDETMPSHSPPHLSEVLEFPERQITLDFHVAAPNQFSIQGSDMRGTNMYYLLRDDEIIDVFLLHPGEEIDGMDMLAGNETGSLLSVEVELSERLASYQIIGVPEPFSPKTSNYDLEQPAGNQPATSNALLLRYSPQRVHRDEALPE